MIKHDKRYMIIVSIQTGTKKLNTNHISFNTQTKVTYEHYDTKSEVTEAANLYDTLYKDEVMPEHYDDHYINIDTGERCFKRYYLPKGDTSKWKYQPSYTDYSDGKKFWCYIVLDFDSQEIIRIGGQQQYLKTCYGQKIKTSLHLKDRFFRGDDEVPKDYVWKPGEYAGWLQFRWGDGTNSITYVEKPKKPKNNEPTEEATEEDLKKYVGNYSEHDHTNIEDDSNLTYYKDYEDYEDYDRQFYNIKEPYYG